MKKSIHLSILLLFISLISTSFIQAQICEQPDNGTGTVTLPAMGCDYYSPDDVFMIINDLPAGTTIELDGPLTDYVCGSSLCSMSLLPGECEGIGGSLGGNFHCFESTLELQVTGTGQLAGFFRTLSVPVSCEVHTGPRNPGDPVQTFPNEMYRLQGQLFGDPDFCTFNITAGVDYGLPSPGQTTLTQLPSGDFNVDSFFDITYQIEFEGCPGSILEGFTGTTTATIRMETGEPYLPLFGGVDQYTSPCGTFNFGENEDYIIPADFFGPGSDPFDGIIALKGLPSDGSLLPNPDAIIMRTSDVNLDPFVPETVPIEIVQMSLAGTTPIKVTYNGGMVESFFDVFVEVEIGFPSTGNCEITQLDDYGGDFDYDILVFPEFTFVEQGTGASFVFSPGGLGLGPVNYASANPNLWTLSPIPGEFDVVSDERIVLQTPAGTTIELLPLPIRYDNFSVWIDESGAVENSFGTGWNNSTWYYYPEYPWTNVWFYNHPFDPDRRKIIDGMMVIEPRDPGINSFVEIVWNWTTPLWPGWPDNDSPPLPEDVDGDPFNEDDVIVRSDPPYFIDGFITEPIQIPVPFEILEYNPEWLSVDIRGSNFILSGDFQHICWTEGNCSEQDIDWGDAPDQPYPTFAASNGANHIIDGITYLGNMVDGEPDGQPDPNALGDDNNGPDEDGVIFTSPIISGQIATLDVFASIDGFLNLWVDFDINGSWADAGEYVYDDYFLTAGLNPLSFPVPASSLTGTSFARFRFCSDNDMVQSYEGGVANGEVEDYEVFIEEGQVDEFDFGDASDPTYPTLLASNGARHILDGVTFLGASVDPEPDGQPDGTATGDDNDGNNDEDGITFNQILAGSPAQITVTTSVAGYLQGWMDFNADGDWADPGEQIFLDEYIHFGYTVCLNYVVPVNANLGIASARFRFSTVPGLSYTGPAQNGEVEDYEVEITEDPNIKWIQEPCVELPGLHAHDYVTPPDFYDYIIIADDWLCNGGLVTDIHWWGNYESQGGGIQSFHLSIHDDDPTGTCLPGQPVWQQNVLIGQVNETATGWFNSEGGMIYLYEYYLDIPFEQIEGNTYWLDICAYSNDPIDPAIWRWQESGRSTNYTLCPASSMTSTTSWQWIVWNTPDPTRYNDMAFVITSEEIEPMDFGDAADPTYPTYLVNDGARHLLDGITFMGTSVDSELFGQADPNAMGDDNDGNDDEDGVTLTSPLIRDSTTTLDVVASVDGYLDAWLDFNANGIWEAGEVIFASAPLVLGMNNLSFNVPSGAIPGITYSRFRFSSYGGLLVTGLATDGEVEDYEVEIVEVPNKWVQYPNPQLPGLHAHDYDLQPAYGQIILADDWVCQGGWVTDIHWWGNYELDPFGDEIRGAGIEYFHLSIHNLDATGCIPLDPEIWGEDVPFSTLTEIPTGLVNLEGCDIYLYEYILENPFPQIEGTHYWLDITAVCTDPIDPAYWRWQESSRMLPPILCGAVEKTLPNPGTWNTIIWANETNSDMAFMLTSMPSPEIDMGDAADPTYPTLLINNGAAHILDGVTFLGAGVDAEPDGQPDPQAMGDDNDGNDDEDGVTLNSAFPITLGGTPWFDIQASVDGILNVWIDWNGNGSWSDIGDHATIDYSLVAGLNTVQINVPANAVVGTTYARFRFNSVGGLFYNGLAQDGEVEDYELIIEGDVDVHLTAFLEGPFNGTTMNTDLNSNNLIPLNQPYNSDATAPWYYTGPEFVPAIPNPNIIDWVIVEFRDAPSPAAATAATMVSQQAAFILNDGSIVGLDGVSSVQTNGLYTHNLYVVIWHRDHLGIMSSGPIVLIGINQYTYDFSGGPGQAYLSGQINLGGGIYGMAGGDGKPDGFIDNQDIISIWTIAAGTTGYLMVDYNLDSQVDNQDKNNIWYPNIGSGSQIP